MKSQKPRVRGIQAKLDPVLERHLWKSDLVTSGLLPLQLCPVHVAAQIPRLGHSGKNISGEIFLCTGLAQVPLPVTIMKARTTELRACPGVVPSHAPSPAAWRRGEPHPNPQAENEENLICNSDQMTGD